MAAGDDIVTASDIAEFIRGLSPWRQYIHDIQQEIVDAKGAYNTLLAKLDAIQGGSVSPTQWVAFGQTPTFVTATQFTVPTNMTTQFEANRRVKFELVSGNFVYSSVASSSFASSTTTVNINDSVLTSDLSTGWYSFLDVGTDRAYPDLIGPDFPASQAQGDVFFRGASGIQRLAAGTSGQFLKTQGAAANPVWAAAGIAAGDDPVTWTGSHTWSKAGPQIFSNADSQLLIGHSTDPGWSLAAIHVGARGALFGTTTFTFGSNVYTDGTEKYIATAAAGKIDINGNAISLRTAPSGTAGNAITWTQAIITADPGLVAIGRSASVAGAGADTSVLQIGSESTSAYDITSATVAANMRAVDINVGTRMEANHDAHYGLVVGTRVQADGSARTLTNRKGIQIETGGVGANVTVTNEYSLFMATPTTGGTLNRVVDSNSGAYLTTAGTWTNASSREYKNVIQYLDSPASFKARKAELVATRPALAQWKADHLIHPIRTQAQLNEYNAQNGTEYATFDGLNAAGVATDARWNGAVLEAYRYGRWEVVGTNCKPMDLVLIAEELPEICRTKNGKGLDTAAVCAWLLEICKSQQADIDKIAVAMGVTLN